MEVCESEPALKTSVKMNMNVRSYRLDAIAALDGSGIARAAADGGSRGGGRYRHRLSDDVGRGGCVPTLGSESKGWCGDRKG